MPASVAVEQRRAVGIVGPQDLAFVAEQVVDARATVDGVGTEAADDLVDAVVAIEAVVATLAEDAVVVGPAVDFVVAADAVDQVEADHIAQQGIGLARNGRVKLPDGILPRGSTDHLASDQAVVAEDNVFALAAIDGVVAVRATDHVMAAGDVVVAVAAEQRVVALLTDDDVVALVAVDGVVAAAVLGPDVDRDDPLVLRQGQVEQGMVAEQAVVA